MRALSVFYVILASTVMLQLTGCQNADATSPATQADQQTPAALPVEVSSADRATVYASINTTTILEAYDEADVIARVNGIAENILVEEGDVVKKGQPLLQLDQERFEQAVNQVAAELRGVEQELRRMQEMASQQMASADAVERLQANHDTLKARLRLAEIELESATITAPINGIIAKRYVKTGNLVQQHERNSLFHIVDLNTIQATLHLPERDIYKIQPGQDVELTLNSLRAQQTPVTAKVARISPAVDRIAGTFRVTVELDNPDHLLRAGMFARARVNYAQQQDALRVPHYALIQLDNQDYIYVVEDDIAARRAVETGIRDGEWVEIVTGLNEDDTIVITGQANLNDNARVVAVTGSQLANQQPVQPLEQQDTQP